VIRRATSRGPHAGGTFHQKYPEIKNDPSLAAPRCSTSTARDGKACVPRIASPS